MTGRVFCVLSLLEKERALPVVWLSVPGIVFFFCCTPKFVLFRRGGFGRGVRGTPQNYIRSCMTPMTSAPLGLLKGGRDRIFFIVSQRRHIFFFGLRADL